MTYSKDHRYSMKSGRRGFSTGSYHETGTWDIYLGNRIELNPENRESNVLASDKKLRAEIRSEEKAMDEGAWKPMPTPVSFIDSNSFVFTGTGEKSAIYRRAR
jgi:hypothetical protein